MSKAVIAILLIVALVSTLVAAPLYSYTPFIYGSPSILDLNFVKDYIIAWWQKIVRRYIYGEVGPAESVPVDTQQAETYKLPTTKKVTDPTNIYELIAHLKQNKATYSSQILSYLQQNNLPNKSTQIDLLIVPENIYVTLVWNEYTLEVYDGWIGDENCKEYIVATATSTLIMNLYHSRSDMESAKSLILSAEANGEFSYSIRRLNPTMSETILYLQAIASIISIVGWTIILTRASGFLKNRKK